MVLNEIWHLDGWIKLMNFTKGYLFILIATDAAVFNIFMVVTPAVRKRHNE